ncbi:alpha/beta hydrolase [Deinococcus hohokamensis]|uniref:Alpha/beta hydrolase n=1 Tax=Deinococcus hohokamensis TaxID=309883 RepID=A0ABV9I389_9DEIO
MKNLHRPATLLLLLPLTLASCGLFDRKTPEDQSFQPQALDWKACDPTILGQDTGDVFKALGDRLVCADMKVPMNWDAPKAGTASVSLIRLKAANPSARQGAIFFNPGGPGGDGLAFAPFYGLAWGQADATTTVGANLRKLTEQYDLVGFSPRGVGASTRLYCGSNELVDPIRPPASDRSEANIANMIRSGQLAASACQKNPLTPFINTDATARDLNLARSLMGDAKLNYIGYSYGTWLGSWYAKRFPESTGRMLLDGNMPFHSTMQEAFENDPMTFERDFREVVAPYLSRLDEVFGLGTNGAAVYSRYLALGEPIRNIIGNATASELYVRDEYPVIGLLLKVAVIVDDLIQANPDATTEELQAEAAQATYFQDQDLNEAGRALGAELVAYADAVQYESPSQVVLSEDAATNTAVVCNDTAWNQDLSHWRQVDDRNAVQYPLIGGSHLTIPCLYWKGGPSVKKPEAPANLPAILMLQNEYDPATPKEGAVAALKATPNARMIMIDNEPQHAAFPYDTDCVDLPITRYFLTGELPASQLTACQARPLPFEAQVYPVGESYTTGSLSTLSLRSQAVKTAAGQKALAHNRQIIAQQSAALHGTTSGLNLDKVRQLLRK